MKKKWFIVILVLVIVAVVLAIIFINLFKERDTKALSQKLVEVTETGYLSNANPEDKKQGSDENVLIHEWLSGLETLTDELNENEINTISNYLDALTAYEISVKFFAHEMIFAEATDTYTNNHVKIQNWLSDAQKNANSIKEYVDDVKSETEGSNDWTAKTWVKCRDWMGKLIKNTANAVTKLTEIYRKSVPAHVAQKGIMNNAFTDLVFDTMNEMTENVTNKTIESAEFGSELFVLVNAYLVPENESLILNFPYDKDLQDKVTMLEEIKKNNSEGYKTTEEYIKFVSGEWALA